jgi:hypothetical protein
MNCIFRKGAKGAILDEYEIAIAYLKKTIRKISNKDLIKIVDPKTRDTNCRTIQGILSHVVICGYYTAIRILRHKFPYENPDEKFPYPKLVKLNRISEYNKALDEMFAFTEKAVMNLKESEMRTLDPDKMIKKSWGWYDYEQLLETSIMHVYRHRRQIKKLLLNLNEA